MLTLFALGVIECGDRLGLGPQLADLGALAAEDADLAVFETARRRPARISVIFK
jgi:hypothetical protein